MGNIELNQLTLKDISEYFYKINDAIVVADADTNKYRSFVRRGIFEQFLDEEGDYSELIEKLWFHYDYSEDQIAEDYHVFIPTFSRFDGKYSRKLHVVSDGNNYVLQMTVYPMNENMFIFLLDRLAESERDDELLTEKKVSTIQNTFLFSMYFDLVKDTTSSISITEISDNTVNTQVSYSQWRMMIVNMFDKDDQAIFLERTDPDYLRKNFAPGKTASYDCKMQNLEGKFIWVKLIFSRAETDSEDDYRFVFMVQNIDDNIGELMTTLKKYEVMASQDPLTGINNHGRSETEIQNAIGVVRKTDRKVALIMMDIDFFKEVNDKFGHSAGDATLKKFASILSDSRQGRRSVVGRWGGEEFVAVCYDMDNNEADAFAEEFRQKIENETFDEVGRITCSLGVTDIRAEDEFKDAFDRVDRAMYEAKSGGRNCVRRI